MDRGNPSADTNKGTFSKGTLRDELKKTKLRNISMD